MLGDPADAQLPRLELLSPAQPQVTDSLRRERRRLLPPTAIALRCHRDQAPCQRVRDDARLLRAPRRRHHPQGPRILRVERLLLQPLSLGEAPAVRQARRVRDTVCRSAQPVIEGRPGVRRRAHARGHGPLPTPRRPHRGAPAPDVASRDAQEQVSGRHLGEVPVPSRRLLQSRLHAKRRGSGHGRGDLPLGSGRRAARRTREDTDGAGA